MTLGETRLPILVRAYFAESMFICGSETRLGPGASPVWHVLEFRLKRMTLLGSIFIPLGIGFWLFKPRWLLPLAIIAAAFQAGSVLNIRDVGLPPYYFVSILMVLHLLWSWLFKGTLRIRIPSSSSVYPLLLFWAWASASAVIMPFVFRGMLVLDPSADIEIFGDFPVTSLHFSFGNVVQIVWLTVNLGAILFAARFGNWEEVRKALRLAVGIALTIILVQFVLSQFGYQFPEWLFHSNPGQHQAMLGDYDRPNGSFSEPSIAGVLVTSVTLGALARFLNGGSIWLFAATLICTLLVRSAGSLLALAVGCLILGVVYFPTRKFDLLSLSAARKRYAILALFCLTGIAFVFAAPSINETLAANTVNKIDTASFISRTTADLAGLTVFRDTYGLGVGIGSIRTSGFLATLLATTGLGALLFVWFAIRLAKRTENSVLRWMFLGGLLAQVAGAPDLSLPLLWMNVLVLTVFILRECPLKTQADQTGSSVQR